VAIRNKNKKYLTIEVLPILKGSGLADDVSQTRGRDSCGLAAWHFLLRWAATIEQILTRSSGSALRGGTPAADVRSMLMRRPKGVLEHGAISGRME